MDLVLILSLVLSNKQITYLVGLILAAFLLGVLAAVSRKEWRLYNLADVVERQLLPSLAAYLVIAALAEISPEWATVRDLVFGLLLTRHAASILASLKGLGLPIPDAIAQYWGKPQNLRVLVDPTDSPVPPDPPIGRNLTASTSVLTPSSSLSSATSANLAETPVAAAGRPKL